MPRRRKLRELLTPHAANSNDSADGSPDQQWLRFLLGLPKEFLVAITTGFTDQLTDRYRSALHGHLAWASTVYRFLVKQRRDAEAVRFLRELAETIASRKVGKAIRGATRDCHGIVLLRHLDRIERFVRGSPRLRNRAQRIGWLRSGLPGLFQTLQGIPCTVPHRPHLPSRDTLDDWIGLRPAPLAEHILAHYHSKSPVTIHKRVSRTHRLLTDFARES